MLGKIATATTFIAVVSLGVGAWSYAPSADKKPWRPQATATEVSMPADQLPVPKAKAKPLALIGQSAATKTAAR
ncbi:hypothetical protein [Roseiterribacter gracilis]|uniref:Uncharacterized protein n=1 Tax=Roseiterribacter gracilis TaxID=2812848 RepID=A0A8S8XKF3_9PROT|nr:hypothetical protein TMPK1_35070 [Rhodospirillales bacterium TMPK1]